MADRWHLLNSLTKAVERFFLNHTQDIKAANAATEMLKGQPTKKEIERSQKRTKRMVDNYAQIKALHKNKIPILHIARQLGLSRETVYQYLAKSEPPISKQATYGGKSKIDPHKSYLIKRWNEGIRNASQLHRELIELGVQDLKVGSVKNFVSRLRRAKGEGRSFKPQEPNVQNQFKGAKSSLRIVTAKQVAHLCVSKPEGLRSEQQKFLNQLTQTNSVIAQCYELISQFCAMVKERRGSELDDWLERVYASEVKELQTFARQLEKDKAAVVAGLTLIWSQGQTEGQVQRLKYLKRQMYGQAGFSLLKRRLLHRNKNRSEYPFHVN
ncbi:MAG TPA: transposase [Chloroflexia bacterium]|nr:transposase [Chloroflexia bacterium]